MFRVVILHRGDLIASPHDRAKQILGLIRRGLVVDEVGRLLQQFANPMRSAAFLQNRLEDIKAAMRR